MRQHKRGFGPVEGLEKRAKMTIGLVCSHGGHMTEMLQLLDAFAEHDLFFVSYRSARLEELGEQYRTYALRNIGMSVSRFATSFAPALRILRRERPALLVSTGSEIAVPFFAWAKPLRIRTIFVESCCRVQTASRTGRLVYPLVDSFLVQWPEMLDVYGAKARYEGGLL